MRKSILGLIRPDWAGVTALTIGTMLLLSSHRAGTAEAPRVSTNVFRFVDLSAFANSSEGSVRQFSILPSGLQNFGGVPFRVDSRVTVTGMESARAGEFFPTAVTGIRIGGNAKRIHLLHGTMFSEKDGVPVAKIVFHYAEGGQESVRLGYGIHVRSWIAPRLEKRSELFDPNSQVAWFDSDDRRGTDSRVFQTALENPRPGEVITSVDVVSLFSRAAPFILALTVEGMDSTLPPNRPLPSRKPVRDLRDFSDALYRGEIVVRVTDGPSGVPPTNAVVSLGVTDDKETYFFGESKPDAKGVVHMPYPPLHAVGVSVWVHAPGRAPVIVSESKTNRTKFTGEYAVTLQPGLSVGGFVKDAASNAVSGAQVVIHKVSRVSPHHYGRVDYDVLITGADGKWTSRSLPDDLNGFSFQVMHPDFRPALFVTAGYAPPPTNASDSLVRSSSGVTYQRMPDGTLVGMNTARRTASPRTQLIPLVTTNALLAGDVIMKLQSAMLLEGGLVDTNGKPISDAEVIVQRGVADRKFLRTDAKGNFKTRIGDPGEVAAIIVLRDGFAPLFRNVGVSGKSAPQEIQLAPAKVLKGRVQDRQGRPVSGARVRLDDWNGTSDLLRFQTLTDDQGNFVWTGAPLEQVTFYVSKTNYYNTRHSFAGSAGNVVIPINRAPGVYGKVYDADTKQPIPSFTIIPGRKYSQGETRIQWDRSEMIRGRDGEYALKIESYFFQPEARVMVEAMGYQPQISPAFNQPDSYTNDFALKKGKGIAGVVQLPDGSPLAGATLALVERGEFGYLDIGGQLRGSSSSASELVRTDAKGRFEFAPKLEPDEIFVSHEQGFGEAKVAEVQRDGKIVLQPWGTMKGFMRVGDRAEPEGILRLQNTADQIIDSEGRAARLYYSVKMDAEPDGSFIFSKVPPGEHRLALEYRFKDDRNGDPALSHGFPVVVKAGETTEATLGGTGRRVTGRVKVNGGDQSDVDWRRDVHQLVLVLPGDATANGRRPTAARPLVLLNNVNIDDAGQPITAETMRARQRAERTYVLLFDTNGSFRAESIPPGKYDLIINITDPEDEYYNRRTIGNMMKEVVVPDEPNVKVNAPLDIGVLELTIRPRVKIGKVVPSFEGKTSNGKTIKLSDFRGKYVLLHFWGLSVGYSTYDFQTLKRFQTTYGADRLAILGCNLDGDAKNAEQFASRQNMTWPQIYLGDSSQTSIPAMFGISGNAASVLVDPDGKLVSGQIRGTAVRTMVARALSGDSE